MKILSSIILLFFTLSTNVLSQPKVLKKEGFSIDANNDITKAVVQTETEKTASIQIEFKGFNQRDKEYKITAKILNQVKTAMKEFEPVTVDLDPRSGVADFSFNFVQRAGANYDPSGIESKFIEFAVAPKNSEAIIPGLEDLGLNSTKFVFRFHKKWKVKVIGQELPVKLTPYKTAAYIQQ